VSKVEIQKPSVCLIYCTGTWISNFICLRLS